MNNAPIGIFDSGFGGLTVARAIHERLPQESLIFFGDTARCPYGPRDLREVRGFVHQIGTWLSKHDVNHHRLQHGNGGGPRACPDGV